METSNSFDVLETDDDDDDDDDEEEEEDSDDDINNEDTIYNYMTTHTTHDHQDSAKWRVRRVEGSGAEPNQAPTYRLKAIHVYM